MYKINPSAYKGVFVIPADIAKRQLILAGEKQLKTIIYIFSKPAEFFDAADVANAVDISEDEAADAIAYWENLGYLMKAEDIVVFASEGKKEAEKPPKKTVIGASPQAVPTRLNYSVICERIGESEEVRFLFSEAQIKLGRTIGTADQSSLLLLHDYYGLPVEIILSICEYARTHGKSSNINYIYTLGVDWSKREIDTLERADEEFKILERVNAAWTQFCSLTGLKASRPTVVQQKYLSVWLRDWRLSMPLIVKAYEEMLNHTEKLSFQYINKTLSSWRDKGIKTPEDAEKDKKDFLLKKEREAKEKTGKKKKASAVNESGQEASYDIEKAENKAKTSVPALKKRRA